MSAFVNDPQIFPVICVLRATKGNTQSCKVNEILLNKAKWNNEKVSSYSPLFPVSAGMSFWGMNNPGALQLHILIIESPKSADKHQKSLMESETQWPSSLDELQRFLQKWNWNRAGWNYQSMIITRSWHSESLCLTPPRGNSLCEGYGRKVSYLDWDPCDILGVAAKSLFLLFNYS